MMTDEQYPYTAREETCKEIEPAVTFDLTSHTNLAGYYLSSTVDEMVDHLTEGPLSVCIFVDTACFWNYSEGVIYPEDCGYENSA